MARAPAATGCSVAVATRRPDPTAFLLLAGGAADSETIAAEFIAGDSHGVRTWTVPGAGHVQGLRTAPEEWERRVVTFLDASLR